ncbi:MAG: alcohol dehydrogenase catalytic domain-containing protein [Candidatus Aminicenantes bacterium]|nr:alcohol dehydrogenase catalytic domain-containing protein [Candidatus Aminicenantes bacterium]
MPVAAKMKAAVWYNNRDIRIEEVPLRSPGPREMVVKVLSCGICGSDVVEWYRLPRAPLVQGHEIGAEVVEIGSSVDRFKPGDRVFIAPKVPCGACSYCREGHFPQCSEIKERLPGGFAEYILVPEVLVEKGAYLLPGALSYDQSTFIEPLACVVRSQRLAGVKGGQSVLVLGCGMSGLLQIQLAKTKECTVVATDVGEKKLSYARRFGADLTLPAGGDVPQRLTDYLHKKADVVMLCSSALTAVEQAWSCVDKGGAVVFFAVPGPEKTVTVPVNNFWTQEVRILTSYYCGPPDIQEAMRLLAAGAIDVDSMITHRLPLEDIDKGFQLVMRGEEAVKVIIKPHARDGGPGR